VQETYLSPSSSAAETDDGKLICELRDVQRETGLRWKLVAVSFDVLKQAEEEDAVMNDGSILLQALESSPSWNEIADIAELIHETQLSRRQAEFYAWKVKAGLSISQATREMGIGTNNGRGKWHDIKEKIREAQEDRTAELEIPG